MIKWIKIADSETELNIPGSGLLEVEVSGKKICLARGKELRACAARCPHAGGVIADGFVNENGVVTCPLHRYKFSLENGRNVSGEGFYLKTYPVRVTEEGVFVGLAEGGLWGWLK